MRNKIREEIFKLSDERYREFNTSLNPGVENIIGVRVPILRNYAKELAKQNWKQILEEMEEEYYEEVLLKGMIIGYAKMDIDTKIKYIKEFVPKINSWAICDSFCTGLKITKNHMGPIWDLINEYLKSKKEFELRFAIVMMLNFYITEEYIDKVLEVLNKIHHDGYYVKMAVAWTLSVCYIKFQEKTFALLEQNELDDFTYNKALQKIIESYRVSKQDKEIIRSMKRK